jgi:hypothetical protein
MPIAIPDIRFLFTGLLAMHQFSADRFDIGVHSKAGHELKILIIERSPLGPDLIRLERDDLGDEVFFDVVNPVHSGVSIYTNGETFDRSPLIDDENDFRWMVEFDGPEFHNRPLQVNEGIFNPIIYIRNGTFYTAKKSLLQKIHPMTFTAPGPGPQEFTWFVGADVFLGESESSATLRYGAGDAQSYTFTKGPEKMYLVVVLNLAPSDHPSSKMASDFQFYYDAFDVPLQEKFDVIGALTDLTNQTAGYYKQYDNMALGEGQKDAQEEGLQVSDFVDDFVKRIKATYTRPCIPGRLTQSTISRSSGTASPVLEKPEHK